MKTRLLTPRSKGFTLIEVLVVIAIIALLAGVSYSIYSHATETAARTRCTDNLRRISDWGKEFAGQNGGKLPSSGMKDSLLSARECRNWWDALAPIVNAEQPDLIARNAKEPNMLPDTFRCKNDKRPEILGAEDANLPAQHPTQCILQAEVGSNRISHGILQWYFVRFSRMVFVPRKNAS